jgi:hypothetical protein
MSITPAGGLCRHCNHFNAYTSYACEKCQGRLVWADAAASTSGENGPECQHFNNYTQTNCEVCQALLPWSECPAARHVVKGSVEIEQKSLAYIIAFSLILLFLLLWFIVYNVSPTK